MTFHKQNKWSRMTFHQQNKWIKSWINCSSQLCCTWQLTGLDHQLEKKREKSLTADITNWPHTKKEKTLKNATALTGWAAYNFQAWCTFLGPQNISQNKDLSSSVKDASQFFNTFFFWATIWQSWKMSTFSPMNLLKNIPVMLSNLWTCECDCIFPISQYTNSCKWTVVRLTSMTTTAGKWRKWQETREY